MLLHKNSFGVLELSGLSRFAFIKFASILVGMHWLGMYPGYLLPTKNLVIVVPDCIFGWSDKGRLKTVVGVSLTACPCYRVTSIVFICVLYLPILFCACKLRTFVCASMYNDIYKYNM